MRWKERMAAIISVFGTILVVESVGLGQYLASALTMDTPQKRYIWGIVGVGVLVFLLIVNYTIMVKKSKKKTERRYAS
jgi:membrane protein DedA with SNARE-associated domain